MVKLRDLTDDRSLECQIFDSNDIILCDSMDLVKLENLVCKPLKAAPTLNRC